MNKSCRILKELNTGVLSESTLATLRSLVTLATATAHADPKDFDMLYDHLTSIGVDLVKEDRTYRASVNATAAATWGGDDGR